MALPLRAQRIRYIRLALAAAGTIVVVSVAAWVRPLARFLGLEELVDLLDVNEIVLDLLKRLPVVGNGIERLVRPFMSDYPLIISAVIGSMVTWYGSRMSAERIYERAFAVFDDNVLTRVKTPRAFDPLRGAAGDVGDMPMVWTLPEEGPRRVIWDGLVAFAHTGIGAAGGARIRGRPEVSFGWTILMGRAGSGKSRMAVQLARELGQRKFYGGEGQSSWRIRLALLRTWWRVQLHRNVPAPVDPWDAGWLQPGVSPVDDHPYPERQGRREASEDWKERLRKWRPRRPTFLLLDDPRILDADQIIGLLEASASRFRHPVRLLIVNQTAPAELRLTRTEATWRTIGKFPPLVQPVLLSDECRFFAADLRAVRGPMLGSNYVLQGDEAVDQFLKVTRGNPLLVELGLKALREGIALSDISEQRLLVGRVDGVLDALRQAGLPEFEHHCAIAVATLAGGAVEAASKDPITRVFRLPLVAKEELARVFPGDAVDLRNRLPPIRPETIGYAFARRIVEQASDAMRPIIVATAWSSSPRGTFRTALQVGSRADTLGRLFAAGPPPELGFDPLDVAISYADEALELISGDLLDERGGDEPGEFEAIVIGRFVDLPLEALWPAAQWLVELDFAHDRDAAKALFWMRLLRATLGALKHGNLQDAANWEKLVADMAASAAHRAAGLPYGELKFGFAEIVDSASSFLPGNRNLELERIRMLNDLASTAPEQPRVRLVYIQAVEKIASDVRFAEDREIQYCRAFSWLALKFDFVPAHEEFDNTEKRLRQLASTIDRIGMNFENDEQFRHLRALAQVITIPYLWPVSDAARKAADYLAGKPADDQIEPIKVIDRIYKAFPDDVGLQEIRRHAFNRLLFPDYHISFDWSDATISENESLYVNGFISNFHHHHLLAEPAIRVVGHADSSEDEIWGLHRAMQVKLALVAKGFSSGNIIVTNRGKEALLVETTSGERRNRRVEICAEIKRGL